MTWTRISQVAHLSNIEQVDLLVIGGGIVGAGTALDAASRGLSVLLVERTDFAAETSSRSSKLLHGGIRYLPQFRFKLVREGLLEQKVLATIADYLYEPLEFILPMYEGRGFGDVPSWVSAQPRLVSPMFGAGLKMYDTLGGRSEEYQSSKLSSGEITLRVPKLKTEGLTGGFSYFDARTDDARLTAVVLKTAVRRHGAVVVNWTEATGVEKRGEEFLVGLRDRTSGAESSVRARAVVAATGPFRPVPGAGEHKKLVLSKGVHLVMDATELGIGEEALVLPETEDGRILFLIPFRNRLWVGTTDTLYDGDPDTPVATEEDVEYIRRQIRQYMDVGDMTVTTAIAGLRALAAEEGEGTAEASREPAVIEVQDGYWQVAGGKLTGYRPMAQRVVDEVVDHLGERTPSETDQLPLVGSGSDKQEIIRAATDVGYSYDYGSVLYDRYGREAFEIIDRSKSGINMWADGMASEAEFSYTCDHESVASLADFLMRRTHVAWFVKDHGRSFARAMAEASNLGAVSALVNDYEDELAELGI
ncbi:MAG: glycerol-3-phosphate dehydrogenase/oxidase [Acidimicrobiia bacterium]|nr:glycerol-3-phosphate dehydrogenase/oxidase [Acidimicrobiia bacterium]